MSKIPTPDNQAFATVVEAHAAFVEAHQVLAKALTAEEYATLRASIARDEARDATTDLEIAKEERRVAIDNLDIARAARQETTT